MGLELLDVQRGLSFALNLLALSPSSRLTVLKVSFRFRDTAQTSALTAV